MTVPACDQINIAPDAAPRLFVTFGKAESLEDAPDPVKKFCKRCETIDSWRGRHGHQSAIGEKMPPMRVVGVKALDPTVLLVSLPVPSEIAA